MSAMLKEVPFKLESQPEPIHSRALKVSLHVSMWTARKHDKTVSKQATDANGAKSDAGRFNKLLIPSDAVSYKALVQLVNAVRTKHYANTLPWEDEGWRLLPTANFSEYSDFTRQAQSDFSDLLEDFLTEYPKLKANAPARLGAMYEEKDFPDEYYIRRKFGFDLNFTPLAARGDFRVDLPQEEIRRLEKASQEQITRATDTAMQDAWGRLHKAVSSVSERLSNPDNIFRDSLIDNAKDLCDLLQRLNITGDANLEAFRQEVSDNIACQDPDMLREDVELRQAAATMADDIVSRMADFYTPEEN